MVSKEAIQSIKSRQSLKARKEPYWSIIIRGFALGYYKGKIDSSWYIRRRHKEKYKFQVLGIVDDFVAANGKQVLSYEQAKNKALKLLENERA